MASFKSAKVLITLYSLVILSSFWSEINYMARFSIHLEICLFCNVASDWLAVLLLSNKTLCRELLIANSNSNSWKPMIISQLPIANDISLATEQCLGLWLVWRRQNNIVSNYVIISCPANRTLPCELYVSYFFTKYRCTDVPCPGL